MPIIVGPPMASGGPGALADTELPVPAAPTDADANGAIPAAASRMQAWAGSAWARVPLYTTQPADPTFAFGARIISSIVLTAVGTDGSSTERLSTFAEQQSQTALLGSIDTRDNRAVGATGEVRAQAASVLHSWTGTTGDDAALYGTQFVGSGYTSYNTLQDAVRIGISVGTAGHRATRATHTRFAPDPLSGSEFSTVFRLSDNGATGRSMRLGIGNPATNGYHFYCDGPALTQQGVMYFSDASGVLQEFRIPRRAAIPGDPEWSDPLDGTGPSGITLDLTLDVTLVAKLGGLGNGDFDVWINGVLVVSVPAYLSAVFQSLVANVRTIRSRLWTQVEATAATTPGWLDMRAIKLSTLADATTVPAKIFPIASGIVTTTGVPRGLLAVGSVATRSITPGAVVVENRSFALAGETRLFTDGKAAIFVYHVDATVVTPFVGTTVPGTGLNYVTNPTVNTVNLANFRPIGEATFPAASGGEKMLNLSNVYRAIGPGYKVSQLYPSGSNYLLVWIVPSAGTPSGDVTIQWTEV